MSLALALFASLSLAPQPIAPAESIVLDGTHFQLVSDFPDDALGRRIAAEALEVVEATWEPTVGWIGEPVGLDELLIVHLYRTYDGYVAAEAQLTHGAFKDNWGFSSFEPRGSHVPLQPPASDRTLERVGLPAQTQRILAHEASHLVAYARFANVRSHPDWFSEGLACHIAEGVLVERGLVGEGGERGELGEDPHYASVMGTAKDLSARGELPSVEQILLAQFGDLGWGQAYDIQNALADFLSQKKHAKHLREVIDLIRREGGGGDFTARILERFKSAFGSSAYKKLDAQFANYLAGLEPRWEEVYRSLGGPGLVQLAFPNKNAIAWRVRAPKAKAYTLSGTLEVLDGAQMNLLLDRSDAGFVSLALVAGSKPSVTAFDFVAATGEWKRLASESLDELPFGEARAFELKLKAESLELSIGGTPVLDLEVPGHDFRGPWGLGAQAGSAGIWTLDELPRESSKKH